MRKIPTQLRVRYLASAKVGAAKLCRCRQPISWTRELDSPGRIDGCSTCIVSDNGIEFARKAILNRRSTKRNGLMRSASNGMTSIPKVPGRNDHMEPVNGNLRDECMCETSALSFQWLSSGALPLPSWWQGGVPVLMVRMLRLVQGRRAPARRDLLSCSRAGTAGQSDQPSLPCSDRVRPRTIRWSSSSAPGAVTGLH